MLVAGELAHVGAHLGDHHQRGGHIDAVDAGEVHTAHLKELGAQIELRGIAGAPALLAFGRFVFAHMQDLQLRLNLRVALGQLGATEVKRVQGLLQGKEVLGAPTALQALGDLVLAGADARILQAGQSQAIALTGDDGAQDLLARLAGHVGDDIGQLDVHLGQGLLHVLHEAALAAQQHGALAAERAQHADLIAAGRKAPRSRPKLMSCYSHWQSSTSLLRPETFLT